SKLARTTVDPVRSPRAVPLGSTERTRGSSLDHSTSARSRDLWSSSITLAVNTRSWPSETEAVPGSTVTRETTTGATTSVWQATVAVSAEIANTIRATDFLPIRVLQGVTSRPPPGATCGRSEERRVGKEWRSRWWPYQQKKNQKQNR